MYIFVCLGTTVFTGNGQCALEGAISEKWADQTPLDSWLSCIFWLMVINQGLVGMRVSSTCFSICAPPFLPALYLGRLTCIVDCVHKVLLSSACLWPEQLVGDQQMEEREIGACLHPAPSLPGYCGLAASSFKGQFLSRGSLHYN